MTFPLLLLAFVSVLVTFTIVSIRIANVADKRALESLRAKDMAEVLRTEGLRNRRGELVTRSRDANVAQLDPVEERQFFHFYQYLFHNLRPFEDHRVLYAGRGPFHGENFHPDRPRPLFFVVRLLASGPVINETPASFETPEIEAIAQKYDEMWKRRDQGNVSA